MSFLRLFGCVACLILTCWQNNNVANATLLAAWTPVITCPTDSSGTNCVTGSKLFIDSTFGSSIDAGWIEGVIVAGASGSATAQVDLVWTPGAAMSGPLTAFEGVQCNTGAAGVDGTTTFVGTTAVTDKTAFFSATLPQISAKSATATWTLPSLNSFKGLTAVPTQCSFAISVGNNVLNDYRKASSWSIYIGKLQAVGTASAVATDIGTVTNTFSVSLANYLSYWTWYYPRDGINIDHVGQIFGRSGDVCPDDNCVALKFTAASGNSAVNVTARYRLPASAYASAVGGFTVGLTNDGTAGTNLVGFSCTIANLNAAVGTQSSSASGTVIPVKYVTASGAGAAYSTITATYTSIYNPLYGLGECSASFPVVGNSTDTLDWTKQIYVATKSISLGGTAAKDTTLFVQNTMVAPDAVKGKVSFNLIPGGGSSSSATTTPADGCKNGAIAYGLNWILLLLAVGSVIFQTEK